ncbi:MAG: hypothetical protein JNJ77_19275 [Planctomycetia bacterium]|nr:hypothetical protein [Planctomycetia bacterium]
MDAVRRHSKDFIWSAGWYCCNDFYELLECERSEAILFRIPTYDSRQCFCCVDNITNEGNKEAEDVIFVFGVSGKIITEAKVSPDILRAVKNSKDDTLNVELKMLNVGETVRIVVSTNNPTPKLEYVANLRGKGVIGKEGSNLEQWLETQRFQATIMQWGVYLISFLSLAIVVMLVVIRKRTDKIFNIKQETIDKLLDERKYVEAYLKREEARLGINRASSS